MASTGAVRREGRGQAAVTTEESDEPTSAEPELEAFRAGLRARETVYDTVRSHQALGHLTPAEYLASLGIEVYRGYRTSARA